jgi:[ribosomal protein S5]-alanine N-acetyltransferase
MEEILMEHIKVTLSNEKLSLREFTKDDWKDVHRYASQDIVCQYQPLCSFQKNNGQ